MLSNMMIWRWTGRPFIVIILLILSACTYALLEGNWVHINAPSVHFDGVAFRQNPAGAGGHNELCYEARDEIEQKLISGLPAKLGPILLQGPETAITDYDKAFLRVQIASCYLDSYQWNVGGGEPAFTYYMTLIIHVTLKIKTDIVLDQTFKTSEQVNTDTSAPFFEFTYRDAVVRILSFFDQGNVWTSKAERTKPVPANTQGR